MTAPEDPFRLEEPDGPEAPKPSPPPPPDEGNGHARGTPFHLDPEAASPLPEAAPPPAPAPPAPPGPPAEEVPEIFLTPEPALPQESFTTAVPRRGGARKPSQPVDVSERTVAERRGRAVILVTGVRPPPPAWPLEALRFPLRYPGPMVGLPIAAVLAFLDSLAVTPLGFLGLLLKIPLLVLLVRWLLHEVGMSAGGRDHPVGLTRILDMDGAALRGFLGIFAVAAVLLLPGAVAMWLGRTGLGIGLLIGGSAWLSVALLGAAVGDPGLAWPWRAAEWLVKRPLPFLVGAAGPWALGLAEVSAFHFADRPYLTALAIDGGVRLGVLYVWLLAARAIGVAGRTWTPPWERNPIEGG